MQRVVMFFLVSCLVAVVLLLLRAWVLALCSCPDMMLEVRAAGWAFVAAVYIFVGLYCVEG